MNVIVICVVLVIYVIGFILYAQCNVKMFRESSVLYKMFSVMSNIFVVLPLTDPAVKDFDLDINHILYRVILRVLENMCILSAAILYYYVNKLYNYQQLDWFVLYFLLPISLLDIFSVLFYWIYIKINVLGISPSETFIHDRILF